MAKITIVFGSETLSVDGELERIVDALGPTHKTASGLNPIETERGRVYVNAANVQYVREARSGKASFA